MSHAHALTLASLLEFVRDERDAGHRKLLEVWERPLRDKLDTGWSQRFLSLERGEDPGTLWARIDEGESRFREGDMLVLHSGHPMDAMLARHVVLESEEDDRWLLRGHKLAGVIESWDGNPCFADPDAIDLTGNFEQALEDIGTAAIGREVVLPLLNGELQIGFDLEEMAHGERVALERGFDATQAEAVAMAYGAERLACIQGPPGTGKSSVLALIARLLVERGERVFVTSHTHMAINNALNKIGREGVPVVKIGRLTQRKGLSEDIACHERMADWVDRPTDGYVVGATPFATCSARLAGFEFDTVLFDEASQVTVPLALMAMRKGRRFVFVGDHRQLPPVMLSRSVLDKDSLSAFAALTSRRADHTVMLDRTYRMNRWLSSWPSRTYYHGRLESAGANRERRLALSSVDEAFRAVLDPAEPAVFIPTLDGSSRSRNFRDARLVAALCNAAVTAGLPPDEIGIVTPYRAQGRAVRKLLRECMGPAAARQIVADTVERMQGQEREMIVLTLASADPMFLAAVAEFFFQPQRLNVSITRARSKLIVIGPEPDALPRVDQREVQRWIDEYVDLVRHLSRMTVDGP